MINSVELQAVEAGLPQGSAGFTFYKGIPGWFDFHDLYQEAASHAKDGDVLVEVGALFGASIAFLADATRDKKVELHVIDTWAPLVSMEPLFNDIVEDAGGRYEAFEFFMKQHGCLDRLHIHREDSINTLLEFPDRSISFLFLDGAHNYNQVSKEIRAGLKKVKLGGVLAGHDFNMPSVRAAVRDWLVTRGFDVVPGRAVPSWRCIL